MSRRPAIAVLSPHWESASEEGWTTRQVAGALSIGADVHVITPEGEAPSTSVDGVFTLHRLGTPPAPTAATRRRVLIEGIAATRTGPEPSVPPALAALLDDGTVAPWAGAAEVIGSLAPDRVVIAGHDDLGVLAAVDRYDASVPVTLVALGSDPGSVGFPHFRPLFERADSVLTVTETERALVVEHHGHPERVSRIGAPMAANPSALSEPNTWVGRTEYVLVLTGVAEDADLEQNELARLVRMRFPDRPVGVAHTDAFCAWHHGQVTRGWPIERTSDRDRLMAWARVTVDLDPGPLFARRCVTSLLYGTPIVVPAASRAREHAARGRGGLWFGDAAELVWGIEALLDPTTRAAASRQGLAYAEEEYGSTDRFIERVTRASGLTPAEPSAAVVA
jgi:hypothetical protein